MKSVVRMMMLVLAVALLAAACNKEEEKGPSVAFVDANRVFLECDAGKKIVGLLQAQGEALQGEMMAAGQEMQKAEKDEDKQKIQMRIAELRNQLQTRQQKLFMGLNEHVTEVFNAYITEKKLSAILSPESAIAFAKDADVTDEIIARMNARAIDVDALDKAATEEAKPEAVEQSKPEAAEKEPKAEEKKSQ